MKTLITVLSLSLISLVGCDKPAPTASELSGIIPDSSLNTPMLGDSRKASVGHGLLLPRPGADEASSSKLDNMHDNVVVFVSNEHKPNVKVGQVVVLYSLKDKKEYPAVVISAVGNVDGPNGSAVLLAPTVEELQPLKDERLIRSNLRPQPRFPGDLELRYSMSSWPCREFPLKTWAKSK